MRGPAQPLLSPCLFLHVPTLTGCSVRATSTKGSPPAAAACRRTGVDMMNLRVLVGYLVQKLVKGTTQVGGQKNAGPARIRVGLVRGKGEG